MKSFKDLLPQVIRRPLGRVRVVGRRLAIWFEVAMRISGVRPEDRHILRKAIVRAPISVWEGLDEWQFPMVERDCTVRAKGVGIFTVRAMTDDLFHVLPNQEPSVERSIRRLLKLGDTFVDAGSNIGYYTVLAARLVGPQGKVIACEMMPETARILREHVVRNNAENVTVIEGALSDSPRKKIKASHPEGKYGQASIARKGQGEQIVVRTMTLKDILQDEAHVRVMKMDLEGAELSALQGLGAAIDKIDYIVFENRDAPEVVEWLEDHSFTVSRLDGANALASRKIFSA